MGYKIIFRADGNEIVGAGHVMRCLSLACAAKELGNDCLFVAADSSYQKTIESFGINNIILETNYSEMNKELSRLENICSNYKPDLIVVDSYYVNNEYFCSISKLGKIIYIDDLVNNAYDVDYLVNYNAYANEADYLELYEAKGYKIPQFLLGVKYAPLRREFQKIVLENKVVKVKDILFSAGGADPERIALNFVNELIKNETKMKMYNFHLVLGSFEPDKEEIKALSSGRDWLIIHENVSKMSELMLKCQMAISAAGSTLYELCACGVPTITYVLADNQIFGAQALSNDGTMVHAGDFRISLNFYENLMLIIDDLADDEQRRYKMSKKAKSKIDGNGAKRTIKELIDLFCNGGYKNELI